MVEQNPIIEKVEIPKIYLPNNVRLEIIFTNHEVKEDLGDFLALRNKIKRTDIFLIEALGYTTQVEDYYKKLAKGQVSVKSKNKIRNTSFQDFSDSLQDLLINTQTNIAIVEPDNSNQIFLDEEVWSHPFWDNQFEEKFFLQGFEKAKEFIIQYMQEYLAINIRRENYILNNIGPVLDELIKNHPKLKNKPEILAVMLIGNLHLNLFTTLEKVTVEQKKGSERSTPEVKAQFIEPFSMGDPISKLTKHYVLNNNPKYKLSDIELNLEIERAIGSFMLDDANDSRVLSNAKLKVLYKLSSEDIINLYNTFQSGYRLYFNGEKPEVIIENTPIIRKIKNLIKEETK